MLRPSSRSFVATRTLSGAALWCSLPLLVGCSAIVKDFEEALSRDDSKPQAVDFSSGEPARASLSRGFPLTGNNPNPLPEPALLLTREVKRELERYLKGGARCVKTSLELRDPLYETITQIFADEGLPLDLLNLAVIESGFRSEARSPTGALGIWQFTRSTGKKYGLLETRNGKTVDFRKDPIRSTLAAARHLKDLYYEFGDWYLALAAYNAGTGGISRAMRRSGAANFWELARAGVLSRQTEEFVPRFIAATIIVKSAELYGRDNLPQSVMAHINRHGGTNVGERIISFHNQAHSKDPRGRAGA